MVGACLKIISRDLQIVSPDILSMRILTELKKNIKTVVNWGILTKVCGITK